MTLHYKGIPSNRWWATQDSNRNTDANYTTTVTQHNALKFLRLRRRWRLRHRRSSRGLVGGRRRHDCPVGRKWRKRRVNSSTTSYVPGVGLLWPCLYMVGSCLLLRPRGALYHHSHSTAHRRFHRPTFATAHRRRRHRELSSE